MLQITAKISRTATSTITAPPPSDVSDEAEEECTSREVSAERPLAQVDPGEGTSSATRPPTPAATATAAPKPQGKKKRKTSDPDLQELIVKLTDRVEGSRKIREKVNDLLKAVENPHTAYATFLGSTNPSIHPDMWEEYLRKSLDTLVHFVIESKRLRRQEEEEEAAARSSGRSSDRYHSRCIQHQATFTEMQPMIVPQQSREPIVRVSQSSGDSGCGGSGGGGSGGGGSGGGGPQVRGTSCGDGVWDTSAPTTGNNILSSTPTSSSNVLHMSMGSFFRHLTDPMNLSVTEPQQVLYFVYKSMDGH